jgi:hypothetical protein
MMKLLSWRVLVGLAMVLVGVLALAQTLDLISFHGDIWTIIFAVLFGLAGIGFVLLYAQNRAGNWWAVIPGFTMIGLALLIGMSPLDLPMSEILPAIFPGSIGASFAVIYLSDHSRWWAIIPGGVLLSLAVMLLFASSGIWPAVVLFAGMAASFALVAVSGASDGHPRDWAWYPAGALAVVAVIVGLTSGPVPGILWPVLLIAAGAVLVVLTLLRRRN